MQIGRMHQHNINSAVLQSATRLKTKVQRGTRQIEENIAERITKDGVGSDVCKIAT
jgi:hypothetical protein